MEMNKRREDLFAWASGLHELPEVNVTQSSPGRKGRRKGDTPWAVICRPSTVDRRQCNTSVVGDRPPFQLLKTLWLRHLR